MQHYPIINLVNNRFPFGFVQNQIFQTYSKILVRNKIQYKNQIEYQTLRNKLNILKRVFHQNIINLQSIQQKQRGQIVLFYRYVHYKLCQIQKNKYSILKLFHQQLIKMIVHLAKNSIITSFHSENCGFKLINGRKIIKYFLPLSQITISSERNLIQRSVQLFTVQSLQYLDQLIFGKKSQTNKSADFSAQGLSVVQKYKNPLKQSKNKIFSQRNIEHSSRDRIYSRKVIKVQSVPSTQITIQNKSEGNILEPIIIRNIISKSNSRSKQKSNRTDYSSLQRYLSIKSQLNSKIIKIKQRSHKALLKLNLIKIELKKSLKVRRYTQNINNTTKNYFNEEIKHILRKS